MNKEEFINNYTKAINLVVYGEPNAVTRVIQEIIGSLYDQQQMVEYLDSRIIDLERVVYAS